MDYIWKLDDLKKIKKNGLKVFSCFSCGGGSTMGYKMAGCEVLGNVEIDPKMMEMYKKNHNPKYSFLMGVQDFKKIPSKDLPSELFNLDILDGSPPCSTFSLAGSREKSWGKMKKFREGQAEQVLSDLFFDFIDIAEKLNPKTIIAENVKGIILGNAKGYLKAITKKLEDIGYNVQVFLLNAATMGVPQKRERVFFIARRKDLNLPPLQLNFSERPILYKEIEETLKEKYGKPLTEKKTFIWRMTPPGNSLCYGDIQGNSFTSYKIHPNSVLNTITAAEGGDLCHYEKPYVLPAEAYIKCSTFPIDYNFSGNPIKYVVGMSVPPLMTAKIVKEIYKQWYKKNRD